jgi:hypothetical protein
MQTGEFQVHALLHETTTTTNVVSVHQALAAQMAAVVADAEWLEPHERDAVQQLLRKEYTADAPPPPPPPQEYQQQRQPGSQQEPQKQQQSAAQGASQSGQRQISSDAAAAEQQDLPSRPSADAMEELRQQAAGAGQLAEVDSGVETAEDVVPPGVPAEAVRLLRCSQPSSQRHLHSSRCCESLTGSDGVSKCTRSTACRRPPWQCSN